MALFLLAAAVVFVPFFFFLVFLAFFPFPANF